MFSSESALFGLAGGVLIGAGSPLASAATGKIPGISGPCARLLPGQKRERAWRAVFLIGLIGGAAFTFVLSDQAARYQPLRSLGVMATAGFLGGLGTRIGQGCTSGHGMCGLGLGVARLFGRHGAVHGRRDADGLHRRTSGVMIFSTTSRWFVMLLAGTLFGVGLAFSGMTDPARVRGFLDVTSINAGSHVDAGDGRRSGHLRAGDDRLTETHRRAGLVWLLIADRGRTENRSALGSRRAALRCGLGRQRHVPGSRLSESRRRAHRSAGVRCHHGHRDGDRAACVRRRPRLIRPV
jgi:uncharacterized protein